MEATPPASLQLLSAAQPKGRPLAPVYGKLAAEWQVDHWQFGEGEMELPETGQPRAQFPGTALVLGRSATAAAPWPPRCA